MTISDQFKFVSHSPDDTYRLAKFISSYLRPGDCVGLFGGLAAGKTQFAKGMISALGGGEEVTSPTFPIALLHETPQGQVIHLDTYRLASIQEFRNLDIVSNASKSIVIAEWAGLIEEDFPQMLRIEISTNAADDSMRVIDISSSSPRWVYENSNLWKDLGGFV